MICDESVNLVEVCLHGNEVEVLCMGSFRQGWPVFQGGTPASLRCRVGPVGPLPSPSHLIQGFEGEMAHSVGL